MRPQGDTPERVGPGDARALTRLAGRQFGVVAIRQLRELGASPAWVKARLAAGWLSQIHRGVYAVGHSDLILHGRWMAAVLACGQAAVLSHHSAATLWGIRPERPGEIDVTARTTAGIQKQHGIARHRTRSMRDDEVSQRERIPVTSPERTALDIAPHLPTRQLERALDEAVRLRRTDAERLVAYSEGRRGHRGRGPMRRVLATHMLGSTVTRSELEERFLALIRRAGLPQPLINVELLGFVVDCLWPAPKVVVELDGRQSHLTPAAFEADRARDATLAASGFLPLRFTWRQVTKEPQVVADRLRRSLASSWPPQSPPR